MYNLLFKLSSSVYGRNIQQFCNTNYLNHLSLTTNCKKLLIPYHRTKQLFYRKLVLCLRFLQTKISLLIGRLFMVLRPAEELFHLHVYGDITITGEGLQNLGLSRRSGPLSREESLSCHTCCDTEPRFFRSHSKDRPIYSPLTTRKGMRRTYFNPDPHGGSLFEIYNAVGQLSWFDRNEKNSWFLPDNISLIKLHFLC
jgi:hypothetical protein